VLVGTVAVDGVRVTVIPELRASVAVPVFFVSAAEVATTLMARMQAADELVQVVPGSFVKSGTDCGAVKTTVALVELAGIFPVWSLQGVALPSVSLLLLSKLFVM